LPQLDYEQSEVERSGADEEVKGGALRCPFHYGQQVAQVKMAGGRSLPIDDGFYLFIELLFHVARLKTQSEAPRSEAYI
jgi:hypothetical protein